MFKRIILVILVFNITIFSYSEEFKLKEIQLDSKSVVDNQILNNYGNLWICYQSSEKQYQLFGSDWRPVILIEIYYKKGNNLIFLGKIDLNGIYDKNNNLICENILLTKDFIGYTPLGLTEESLEDPFYTAQYLLNNENDFGGLDPYATITINFETNSLEIIKKSK